MFCAKLLVDAVHHHFHVCGQVYLQVLGKFVHVFSQWWFMSVTPLLWNVSLSKVPAETWCQQVQRS